MNKKAPPNLPILLSSHISEKYMGRAYWNTASGVIFTHTIWGYARPNIATFILLFLETYYHEMLHLFFKFRLGKWMCCEKSVIGPLAKKLAEIEFGDNTWYFEWCDIFRDLGG